MPVEEVVQEAPSFTVQLPDDLTDPQFMSHLQQHIDKRGVLTLVKRLNKYTMHTDLAAQYLQATKTSVNFINGVRTRGQHVGTAKRSLRAVAEHFYTALSTPALRQHCAMFNVDYDSYDSVEAIVAVLVDKHVDMVGSSNGSNV